MPLTLTIADWCIMLAGLVIPVIFTIYAKVDKNFDNSAPRDYMEKVKGARKRAYWAVQNGHETYPLFVAAVLLAERVGAHQATVNTLAIAFVGARLVYGLMYILDQAILRSLVWAVALSCIVGLFVVSA